MNRSPFKVVSIAIFSVFTLFSVLLLLRTSAHAQTLKFPGKLTSRHVEVTGTHISIIPLKDFVPMKNARGFVYEPTSESVSIIELPTPVDSMIAGMTKAENLAKQNMKLVQKRDVLLGQYKGVFLQVSQVSNSITALKWILITGKDNQTVMINGVVPNVSPNAQPPLKARVDRIRDIVGSAVYQPERVVNPLATLGFTVDVEKTKFKFAAEMMGSVLFTTDGFVPAKNDDKTLLIVAASLGTSSSFATPDVRESFADNFMVRGGRFSIVKTLSKREVRVDGLNGYEIVSTVKEQGKETNSEMYLLMLFDEQTPGQMAYYVVQGVAETNVEENRALFKTLGQSFKRKK